MKKSHLLFSIIIFTILLSGVSIAQTTTNSVSRIQAVKQAITDIKQKAAEDKAILKARIASTTASAEQELKSSIEIRIGKKLDTQKLKIANVFENSIQNLNDLILRIESRIIKMEDNNIDTSSSRKLLDIARTKVTLAESEVTKLANLLSQNIPTTSSSTVQNAERKTILQNIKTQSDKTKTAIKAAHKSIVDVVVSLKAGQLKQGEATTTTSTSTNN